MRIWLVDPKLLCRQHLLGEHVEIHMLIGCIKRGKNIEGYLKDRIVSPYDCYARHEKLVGEIRTRGYNHDSPLDKEIVWQLEDYVYIDSGANKVELARRCKECRRLQEKYGI